MIQPMGMVTGIGPDKVAQDPRTREWWTCTAPCQTSLASRAEGENWAPMEDVFHTD